MKLLSVNVSKPKTIAYDGKSVTSGIFKESVAGRVMVRKLNLEGDGQADLTVHGGVDKAVYVYDLASYHYWERELGRADLAYGQFGENLTVEGLPDDQVHIGDVFRIGEALLEVSQPRVPCFKLEIKMEMPGFSRQFLASGRLGFYFRVLEEGMVGAGDTIERVKPGPEQMSVRETAHLLYFDYDNLDRLHRALRIPALSQGWRDAFAELIGTSEGAPKKPRAAARAWQGFRTFVVDKKVPESRDITSFYIIPEDRVPLPVYLPGQYLTFKLAIPGWPRPVIRTYSLSDGPCHEGYYRVTIKREPPPVDPSIASGSHYFHDQVEPGARLSVAAPRGDFYLDPAEETPVVLLSGGVGLTPMISMLNAIVHVGKTRPVWFVHGTRNGLHHAMCKHMRQLAAENDNVRVHICYSRPRPDDIKGLDYDSSGHVSVKLLKRLLPNREMDFFLCGPPPFMKSLFQDLRAWGVPEGRIRYELFGPASLLTEGTRIPLRKPKPASGAADFEVVFLKSGVTARWDPDYDNLLDFAEDQGIFPEFDCRSGICQTCMHELLEGEVDYVVEPLDPPYPGRVLLCCARPRTDLVIDV
ncbi:sulfurase [Desulfuromonas versatilis]|uniref:Sulfurase n=1 Tax=Desulfuromonas versatilis TaxID=2802975 RepID=A0ABM8HXW8_9BACT|nr:MOSC domain-containing protein [Desulfuromonas versatilis]BCR05374.1 sulfurase [Desulfuromonas versatilis]